MATSHIMSRFVTLLPAINSAQPSALPSPSPECTEAWAESPGNKMPAVSITQAPGELWGESPDGFFSPVANIDTDNGKQFAIINESARTQSTSIDQPTTSGSTADVVPWTPPTLESELRERFHRDQTDRSLLDYLSSPGDGISPAEAAAEILNDLAENSDQAAIDTALVWQYVKENQIWLTHANENIRSADDFMNSLNRRDSVKSNLKKGYATQTVHRRCFPIINSMWGSSWFGRIPKDMLPPRVNSPTDLSVRTLMAMAQVCRENITIDKAVACWRTRIDARCAKGRGNATVRPRKTPHLLPDDITPKSRPKAGRKDYAPGAKVCIPRAHNPPTNSAVQSPYRCSQPNTSRGQTQRDSADAKRKEHPTGIANDSKRRQKISGDGDDSACPSSDGRTHASMNEFDNGHRLHVSPGLSRCADIPSKLKEALDSRLDVVNSYSAVCCPSCTRRISREISKSNQKLRLRIEAVIKAGHSGNVEPSGNKSDEEESNEHASPIEES